MYPPPMLRWIAPTVALVLAACGVDAVDGAEAAIVGGTRSERDYVVYIEGVRDGLTFSCSGTIIGDYAILTARHCVMGGGARYDVPLPVDTLTIRFGGHADRPTRELRVAEVVTAGGERRSYQWEGKDLAVIIAEEHLGDLQTVVAPDLVSPDAPVTLVGYGTRGGVTGAGERWEGTTVVDLVAPVSLDPAARYFGFLSTDEGEVTGCPGDSGGPVLDASDEVVGVMSTYVRCAPGSVNYHASPYANRGLIRRALARVPGCAQIDPGGGCEPLEVTPLFEEVVTTGVDTDEVAFLAGDVVVPVPGGARIFVPGAGAPTTVDIAASGVSGVPALAATDTLLALGEGDAVALFDASGAHASLGSVVLGSAGAPMTALALGGDTLVAGFEGFYSDEGDDRAGSAYVSADVAVATGEPVATSVSPSFASALAVSGTAFAVGERWASDDEEAQGQVHLYEWMGGAFSETATLVADDPQPFDELGASLDWDGDTLVAGAPGDDTVNGDAGALYVFDTRDLGAPPLKLLPESGPSHGAELGRSVAVDGDYIVAGAPGDTQRAGAVYVFYRRPGGWGRLGRITPSETTPPRFGTAVAIAGDRVAVLATPSTRGGTQDAALSLFQIAGACTGMPAAPPACVPPPAPGAEDAGTLPDAGMLDASSPPTPDAGEDAGGGDATVSPSDDTAGGCGCRASPGAGDALPWAVLLLLVATRRRRQVA